MAAPAPYRRDNPSARYRELIKLYREMHLEGDRASDLAPHETFPGMNLFYAAEDIKALVDRHGAETLLDYGSGKGFQYARPTQNACDGMTYPNLKAFWGVRSVKCYDPAYPPFSVAPTERFDGVISTDVLEHCPEEDLPWIVDEMFGLARRFVFATIASFPALKHLPNGENAHCTIKSVDWWRSLIAGVAERHPGVSYNFVVETDPEDA